MRIGVLCSGGDAPGMNAAIRAIVRSAVTIGDEVVGIRHGYEGLLDEEFYETPKGVPHMEIRSVSGLAPIGGTILHSSRSNRYNTPEGVERAVQVLNKHKIQALIPIGGNGTQRGALDLSKVWDGQVIGLPGTIDNDLLGTEFTIGFATAVNTAVDAVDKLRSTAGSHSLMFLVEVMGRHCGDIALMTAIASGAELVCIPEVPETPLEIVARLRKIKASGKTSVIGIVAEGVEYGNGGAMKMQEKLQKAGNPFESRTVVLGHVLRGGSPVPSDRILAAMLGNYAVSSLVHGETGKMAGLVNNQLTLTSLEECVSEHRTIARPLLSLLHTVAS